MDRIPSTTEHSGSGSIFSNLGTGEQNIHNQQGDHNTTIRANVVHYGGSQQIIPQPTHTIPHQRDHGFVDRPELAVLEEQSVEGSRIALYGLSGVGKTKLAIEYCYRLRKRKPDTWVFWIHAGSVDRYDAEIQRLADDAVIAGRDKGDLYQTVSSWLRHQCKSWLIVLDNADEADFLHEKPTPDALGDRISYLPICSHGSVLITSRVRTTAAKLASNIIELCPNSTLARQLLVNKLSCDNEEATALADTLGDMPLAVAQAAAYIERRRPRCSVQAYLIMLQGSESSLLNGPDMTFLRTYRISIEHIRAARPSAADTLALMSLFNPQDIPDPLVLLSRERKKENSRKGWRRYKPSFLRKDTLTLPVDPEGDLDVLRDYSFISASANAFKMHRLVQQATQDWLREEGKHRQWAAEAVLRLDAVFPRQCSTNLSECRKLYPHVKLLSNDIDTSEKPVLRAMASMQFKIARFAKFEGWYEDAQAAARQSYKLEVELHGEDSTEPLESLRLLASALLKSKRVEEATKLHKQVFDTYEQKLGGTYYRTLRAACDYGHALYMQGQYQPAEKVLQDALDKKMSLSEEDEDSINILVNLARTIGQQTRHDEAEAMLWRAIDGSERLLGQYHPETTRLMVTLGNLLLDRGKIEEAERLAEALMPEMHSVLGPTHPRMIRTLQIYFDLLQVQGRTEAVRLARLQYGAGD